MHLGEKKRLCGKGCFGYILKGIYFDRDAPDAFKKTGLSLYSLVSPPFLTSQTYPCARCNQCRSWARSDGNGQWEH